MDNAATSFTQNRNSPSPKNWFPATSSGQLEVDFTGDQVGDRDEIAQ